MIDQLRGRYKYKGKYITWEAYEYVRDMHWRTEELKKKYPEKVNDKDSVIFSGVLFSFISTDK